jgi:hypothetical protein
LISPGEGSERGIIFYGHTVLSIEQRRELDPTSMASHGVLAVDWASLPNDHVKKIGDVFLYMEDLDYYSNFWAVCGGWHGALPAKSPFMLTKWINLEDSMSRDDLLMTPL